MEGKVGAVGECGGMLVAGGAALAFSATEMCQSSCCGAANIVVWLTFRLQNASQLAFSHKPADYLTLAD